MQNAVRPVTQLTRSWAFGYDLRCVWVFRTRKGKEPEVAGYFADLGAALRYVLKQGVKGSRARDVQGMLAALERVEGELKAWVGVRAEQLKKVLDAEGNPG